MIIFLIIVSALVISLAIVIFCELYLKKHPYIPYMESQKQKLSKAEIEQSEKSGKIDALWFKAFIPLCVFAILIAISLVIFLQNTPIAREKIIQEKATIIYKAYNGEYENEYELLSDIEEFNKGARYQIKHRSNPWISWYFCKYDEQIGLIDYEADIKNITYGKEITYRSEPN